MHTIRLRGPWQVQIVGTHTSAQTFDWASKLGAVWEEASVANATSEVRLTRSFNALSGLEATDRLELVIRGLPGGTLILNQQTLSSDLAAEARLCIRELLLPRNQLTIVWSPGTKLPALAGNELPAVHLEIIPSPG